jgi:hypothetical protein
VNDSCGLMVINRWQTYFVGDDGRLGRLFSWTEKWETLGAHGPKCTPYIEVLDCNCLFLLASGNEDGGGCAEQKTHH